MADSNGLKRGTPEDIKTYPKVKDTLEDIALYEPLLSEIFELPATHSMYTTPLQNVVVGEASGKTGYDLNAPVRIRQKTQGDADKIQAEIDKYRKEQGLTKEQKLPEGYIEGFMVKPINYTGVARGVLQMEEDRVQRALDYLVDQERKGNKLISKSASLLSKINPTAGFSLEQLQEYIDERINEVPPNAPFVEAPKKHTVQSIRDSMSDYPNVIQDIVLGLAATKAIPSKEKLYSSMPYDAKSVVEYQKPAEENRPHYEYYVQKYMVDKK